MKNVQSHWATHFYVGQVAKHSELVDVFTPYADNDEFLVEPWIYSNCKSSCQSPKNADIPWYKFFSAIRPNVEEYMESLTPMCAYSIRSTEAWMNVYYEHGYQEIHDHAFPNRSFSCSYVLEFPQETEPGGQLVFENTAFPIIQSTGINRVFASFNYEKFIPELTPGTLVIFPAWVKHYVLPNRSKQRRVTLTANFCVEGVYK